MTEKDKAAKCPWCELDVMCPHCGNAIRGHGEHSTERDCVVILPKKETIGKKIKRLRQNADMTQAEFAKKLGTDQYQVSKWETGKNAILATNLLKICQTFDVSMGVFDERGGRKT